MSRGGARSRSGPAPTSTDRSHKADAQGWLTLPADGRDGPMPAFPLITPSDREYELWERMWELPQAVAWEAYHLEFELASYVRVLARAELPRSSAMLWAQAKQMAESLGLTASGMQRNRWHVADIPLTEDSDDTAGVPGVASLADRLREVSGG